MFLCIFRLLGTALTPDVRYDQMMTICGGVGYFPGRPEDVRRDMTDALKREKPTLLNIRLSPEPKKGVERPNVLTQVTTKKNY